MLQHVSDDAADADASVFVRSKDARAVYQQVDVDTGRCRLRRGVSELAVGQGIDLESEGRRLTLGRVLGRFDDSAGELGAKPSGCRHEPRRRPWRAARGEVSQDADEVDTDFWPSGEQTEILIAPSRGFVIVARADVGIPTQRRTLSTLDEQEAPTKAGRPDLRFHDLRQPGRRFSREPGRPWPT